jgi:hypothetical protein
LAIARFIGDCQQLGIADSLLIENLLPSARPRTGGLVRRDEDPQELIRFVQQRANHRVGSYAGSDKEGQPELGFVDFFNYDALSSSALTPTPAHMSSPRAMRILGRNPDNCAGAPRRLAEICLC